MFTWLKNAGRIAGALLALPALLACYPQIKALVYEVEDPNVPGSKKKADALAGIILALNALGKAFGVTMPSALIVEFAGPAIDLVVAWENARGNMPHTTTAAAAPLMAAPVPAPAPVVVTNVGPIPVVEANRFDAMGGTTMGGVV
jgi:hypothetical protein